MKKGTGCAGRGNVGQNERVKKGTGWEQVSYRDVQDANEMRMREN